MRSKHRGGPHRGHEFEFDHESGQGSGRGQGRGHGPGRRGPGGRGGGRRGGRRPRVSRGEVRNGILAVLNEGPMHGYQIMQELNERSGGAWEPSPGSVYPTLSQLADEGLIASTAVEGKNVFNLTEDGAAAVLAIEGPPPWERFNSEGEAVFGNLRRSVHQLGAAARQVATAGTPAQVEAANKILAEARKSIYRLLAEDDTNE